MPSPSSAQTARAADHCTVVIFGASGDLTQRKLLPALFNLRHDGLLPNGFTVVGFARRTKTDEQFRAEMLEGVTAHSRTQPIDPAEWEAFAKTLRYHTADFDNPDGYSSLRELLDQIDAERGLEPCQGNRLFYLATPPEAYPRSQPAPTNPPRPRPTLPRAASPLRNLGTSAQPPVQPFRMFATAAPRSAWRLRISATSAPRSGWRFRIFATAAPRVGRSFRKSPSPPLAPGGRSGSSQPPPRALGGPSGSSQCSPLRSGRLSGNPEHLSLGLGGDCDYCGSPGGAATGISEKSGSPTVPLPSCPRSLFPQHITV